MKHIRIFKLVILLFIVMISNISYSQGIVVYKKDGSKVKISYEKFDRIEVYTEEEDGNTTSDYNGHEYVDLGLSVKWATCNVGASSPEEYGKYYAWGELSTKDEYTKDNCKNRNKYISDFSGDIKYDVATKDWGGNWRIPTKAEFQELIDNCTWIWTSINGYSGYMVISKINDNSIFIPAAGFRYMDPYSQGKSGDYWSSTPSENKDTSAYELFFYDDTLEVRGSDRLTGECIRPVFE